MTDDQDLAQQLARLTDQQLGFVAGRLLDHLQADTPLPDEDLGGALADGDDAALVASAAGQLGVTVPAERGGLDTMIAAAAAASPEAREIVRDALARANEPNVRLGPVTFTVVALALAIAGAILRPKVVAESEHEGDRGKKRFEFEFQGIPEIVEVVKAALPFL